MTHFDKIYEIAADNYGLVTYAEALEAGVTSGELRRFVNDGRLERLGQGVYKLTKYIPTHYDQYAEAVALVGPGSYIYGESVLAMHNLALVNPPKTCVAAPKRTRKKLPNWIKVNTVGHQNENIFYEGIPCQSVAEAFRLCKDRVMKDRLAGAVEKAVQDGLIDEITMLSLKKEIGL